MLLPITIADINRKTGHNQNLILCKFNLWLTAKTKLNETFYNLIKTRKDKHKICNKIILFWSAWNLVRWKDFDYLCIIIVYGVWNRFLANHAGIIYTTYYEPDGQSWQLLPVSRYCPAGHTADTETEIWTTED